MLTARIYKSSQVQHVFIRLVTLSNGIFVFSIFLASPNPAWDHLCVQTWSLGSFRDAEEMKGDAKKGQKPSLPEGKPRELGFFLLKPRGSVTAWSHKSAREGSRPFQIPGLFILPNPGAQGTESFWLGGNSEFHRKQSILGQNSSRTLFAIFLLRGAKSSPSAPFIFIAPWWLWSCEKWP